MAIFFYILPTSLQYWTVPEEHPTSPPAQSWYWDNPLTLILIFAVIEPASNLEVLEVASKSIRVSWDASIGEVSGYKVQMIPMMTGSKRQELYLGPGQTSVVVRDLSPDVEYQISLFALKGLMPSEPITIMQKTQPVKVSVGEYNIVMILNNFLNLLIRWMFLLYHGHGQWSIYFCKCIDNAEEVWQKVPSLESLIFFHFGKYVYHLAES